MSQLAIFMCKIPFNKMKGIFQCPKKNIFFLQCTATLKVTWVCLTVRVASNRFFNIQVGRGRLAVCYTSPHSLKTFSYSLATQPDEN